MNRKKTIWIALLAIVAAACGAIWWVFNKPHRNIRAEKPVVRLEAAALIRSFEENDSATHRLYFDQVMEIRGRISQIEKVDSLTALTIGSSSSPFIITCLLDPEETTETGLGNEVGIKGLYVGFLSPDPDFELPGDIKMKNCFILNK